MIAGMMRKAPPFPGTSALMRDIEHAMEVVEGLPYALTGGLFARDPATVRYVRERSPVGNLYVNVHSVSHPGGEVRSQIAAPDKK